MDDLPHGTLPHELEKFKQAYSDSAFICCYRECDRYSDGFSSSAERDEHEKMHAKPFRCGDPTCEFWARGFTSKTGLLKHNRKYHPTPNEIPLPDFDPRREKQVTAQAPETAASPLPTLQEQSPLPLSILQTPLPQPPQKPSKIAPKRSFIRKRLSRAKRGKRVHRCNLCPKVRTEILA